MDILSLPIEIIHIILTYTYKPQPICLRNDIISYFTTKQMVYDRFVYYLKNKRHLNSEITIFKLLLEHCMCYSTGGIPFGRCKYKLYDIFRREYMLQNKSNGVILAILYRRSQTDNPKSRFHICWGLFTPEERIHVIELSNYIESRI